tara:strand:+ start:1037 stop:2092 length:1056 start_codon:yes stop_codon:yes gene_type:complete
MQTKDSQDRFKNYLRKIGSGQETGRSLKRKESEDALKLILEEVPTPAQIGAFLIAHRIKRPTSKELAGMLDTYQKLGPCLKSQKGDKKPICFGMPFDGRSKTAPIYPLTTLILLSAGQPVVLQGGRRMPVKYGITSEELFSALELPLKGLTITNVKKCFIEKNLAFIYQPDHFPLAENLISYREEIGKRPPIASMELMWTSHQGDHIHVSGFVHTPTEERHWEALKLHGEKHIITIKGLEGGVDLPISRSSQIGLVKNTESNRFSLHARDHGKEDKDLSWKDINIWKEWAYEALNNKGPLKKAVQWNAGVYLWLTGISDNIDEGIKKADLLISSGAARKTLINLIEWRSNI